MAKAKVSNQEKIKAEFIAYVLEHEHKPASIFKFVKALKLKEEVFYQEFNSFENVEKQVWLDFFNETVEKLRSDEVFDEYSVREKMLAFFFTWIEVLKANRSYILLTVPKMHVPQMTPYYLTGIRSAFKDFISELLLEAKETEEVKNRPYISNRYEDAIWIQFLFVMNFWLKDESKAFEKTDAAIEKSVNLAFDLMGAGPLDAMVDFGKFLFQNR
ncbi:TetR family transcriptional regulator C-terminal domain-containing protein [Roseivirga pacifica]